jgi:translocation and assembly module TamB
MLEGPLRDPQLSGSARWLGGRLEVPQFGFVVDGIDATIASTGSTELSVDASGNVGSGRLSVTGTTQLDADAGWPTRLHIFGERLEAVRLPEAQILLTPALAVEAALPNISVSGAILVPQARLTLAELPPQAAAPSPDTVVHDVAREAGSRPLNVRADIRVGLGDDVRYTGAGLDVALAGAMGVSYQSGEAAIASGAVTLSGQYQAYGQTLEIEEGRLLFAGPIDNPNLDVRAVRRIDETIAGIQLSGTVEAPVSRVFSEPAMAEADALAYLLLGRPLSATGDEETATLETAAFAMGLQQALPAIQLVGETLGLDEFGVQTTSADTGELMAGKRISPRVYIRYTYGLFNRIGGILMRFNLNNRFSLETRSGDYRSMDLIYTVERD